MSVWSERAQDEANLLNPAFCCAVIASAVGFYNGRELKAMPLPLVFMVLPLVLHKTTREALPGSTRTSMVVWLHNNGSAKLLFHERLMALKPYTQEAIRFGFALELLSFGENGEVRAKTTQADVNRYLELLTDDARDCVLKSKFLGKWFESAGNPNSIMSLWGIRP